MPPRARGCPTPSSRVLRGPLASSDASNPLLPRPPPFHPLPPPPRHPGVRGGHQVQGRPGRPPPLVGDMDGSTDRCPAGLPPPPPVRFVAEPATPHVKITTPCPLSAQTWYTELSHRKDDGSIRTPTISTAVAAAACRALPPAVDAPGAPGAPGPAPTPPRASQPPAQPPTHPPPPPQSSWTRRPSSRQASPRALTTRFPCSTTS